MSTLRIGGLATGMDIDQIVSDLMKIQRMRLDRIKQNRQLLEWQRADFRAVHASLVTLRETAFKLRVQGTFLAKSATSSNETAVTATAGTSAAAGTYSVTVWQLAQGITKGSQAALPDEKNPDGSVKTLKEQFSSLADSITFTLEGKVGDGGARVSRDFVIDTTTATINTLVAQINEHSSSLGIRASYDSTNNRFYLTTTGTGSDYGIRVVDDQNGFLSDAAGAGTGTLNLLLQTGTIYEGQNALFDFGDVAGITSKTNTAAVNGITLYLKEGGGATGTITVQADVDAVYSSIKALVDQYNATIDLIYKELSEERYRDYLPLTDDQREKLSDDQEAKWEEKARSGMLRNDAMLSMYTAKFRLAMGSVVSSIEPAEVDGKTVTHNNLASIGIVTGTYAEKGKLYLRNDGKDLRRAIEADPEGVMNLFTQNTGVPGEMGIAQRLYDDLNGAIRSIVDKAGAESTFSLYDSSTLGKKLRKLDGEIARWENLLVKMEERYWKQFTAMEKAINKLNTQSMWLAQQFSYGQ